MAQLCERKLAAAGNYGQEIDINLYFKEMQDGVTIGFLFVIIMPD